MFIFAAPLIFISNNFCIFLNLILEKIFFELYIDVALKFILTSDQLVGYIRSLEQRVQQLEEERRALQLRLVPGSTDQNSPTRSPPVELNSVSTSKIGPESKN